ncbi:MAG: ATP-binding protein, partial [Spirochaetota bacterium]
MENILDSAEAFISYKSSAGIIEYVNPAYCRVLSRDESQIIGKTLDEIFDPDTAGHIWQLDEQVISGMKPVSTEFDVRMNGYMHTIYCIKSPLIGTETVKGVTTIGFNITEHKISITEKEKAIADLRTLHDRKLMLLSVLGHDLRSPFNGLLGWLSILIERGHTYDEEHKSSILRRLYQSSRATHLLIENMLSWCNAQLHRGAFLRRAVRLKMVVLNCIHTHLPHAHNKNIEIGHAIPDECEVTADEQSLMIILNNLIHNAVKFTPRDGRVMVAVRHEMNTVCIDVRDTGIGMEKEVIRILDQSDSLPSTPGTEYERGHGIGLALCRDLVRSNGGELSIESSLADGTTVTVMLPE